MSVRRQRGPLTTARTETHAALDEARRAGFVAPAELARVLHAPVLTQAERDDAERLVHALRDHAVMAEGTAQMGLDAPTSAQGRSALFRLAEALGGEVDAQARIAAAQLCFSHNDIPARLFERLTALPEVGLRGLAGLGKAHEEAIAKRTDAVRRGDHASAASFQRRIDRLRALDVALGGQGLVDDQIPRHVARLGVATTAVTSSLAVAAPVVESALATSPGVAGVALAAVAAVGGLMVKPFTESVRALGGLFRRQHREPRAIDGHD